MDLLIQLKPSRLYLTLILASAAGGLTGILATAQSGSSFFPLLAIWFLALYWALKSWWQSPSHLRVRESVVEIDVGGAYWPHTSARVMPFLLYFPANLEGESSLLWKDSVTEANWRQLRMWLKIHSV